MKKNVLILLIVSLLASMLSGCAKRLDYAHPQTNAGDLEISPDRDFGNYTTVATCNSVELDNTPVKLTISWCFAADSKTASEEDARYLADIIDNGNWITEETPACDMDYKIILNGSLYMYHGDCGTFWDTENGRYLSVTEEEKENIQEILCSYFPQ